MCKFNSQIIHAWLIMLELFHYFLCAIILFDVERSRETASRQRQNLEFSFLCWPLMNARGICTRQSIFEPNLCALTLTLAAALKIHHFFMHYVIISNFLAGTQKFEV